MAHPKPSAKNDAGELGKFTNLLDRRLTVPRDRAMAGTNCEKGAALPAWRGRRMRSRTHHKKSQRCTRWRDAGNCFWRMVREKRAYLRCSWGPRRL